MKRIFDLLLAVTALVFLAPIFLVLFFLIRLLLGNPVFFIQTRPGLHGTPIDVMKFRTMLDTKDTDGKLLSDEERMSSFGAWLRASSLDELPQLINVVKGDLSLVGPRPLLMEYLPLYSHEQGRRHDVSPGITGWAQVNGRNAISWEEKFALDVWYVDHQSFWLDLKILWMTFNKVFKREGISQEGQATMEPFKGSKRKL